MPTLADIVSLIHEWYPPATAEDWDAVGLVYGDPEQSVKKVMFAVDPSPAVAQRRRTGRPTCSSSTTRCSSSRCTASPRPRRRGDARDPRRRRLRAAHRAHQRRPGAGGVSEALANRSGSPTWSRCWRHRRVAGQADRLRADGCCATGPGRARGGRRRPDRQLRLRVFQQRGRRKVPTARRVGAHDRHHRRYRVGLRDPDRGRSSAGTAGGTWSRRCWPRTTLREYQLPPTLSREFAVPPHERSHFGGAHSGVVEAAKERVKCGPRTSASRTASISRRVCCGSGTY